MKILKAFSALLSYPSTELQAAIPDIQNLLQQDQLLPASHHEALCQLLQHLASGDIYDLEEDYVLLFDRSRSLSLNLFEHVHGESRDRGSAMVDLLQTYQAAGYDLSSSELPDHLPVLLEFLSTQDSSRAFEILQDAGPILVALADRLERRQTPYAAVLHALVDMARISNQTEEAQELLAQRMDNPHDLEALDAVWEETAVTFGPESLDSCSGLLSGQGAGNLDAAEAALRAQLAQGMAQTAVHPRQNNEFPIHIRRTTKAQSANRGQ